MLNDDVFKSTGLLLYNHRVYVENVTLMLTNISVLSFPAEVSKL